MRSYPRAHIRALVGRIFLAQGRIAAAAVVAPVRPRHTAHAAVRGNDADAGGARESNAKAPADAMGTCFSADSGGGGAARAASSGKKGGAAAGGGGPSVKDDYVQGSKLGEGAFGVTYAAKSRATGEDVAIKKVDKRKLRNAHDVEQVRARRAVPVSLPPLSQPLSSRPPHALACARAWRTCAKPRRYMRAVNDSNGRRQDNLYALPVLILPFCSIADIARPPPSMRSNDLSCDRFARRSRCRSTSRVRRGSSSSRGITRTTSSLRW